MDKEKIKLIIRNMELLLDGLKAEIYSESSFSKYNDTRIINEDYDEIYEEE